MLAIASMNSWAADCEMPIKIDIVGQAPRSPSTRAPHLLVDTKPGRETLPVDPLLEQNAIRGPRAVSIATRVLLAESVPPMLAHLLEEDDRVWAVGKVVSVEPFPDVYFAVQNYSVSDVPRLEWIGGIVGDPEGRVVLREEDEGLTMIIESSIGRYVVVPADNSKHLVFEVHSDTADFDAGVAFDDLFERHAPWEAKRQCRWNALRWDRAANASYYKVEVASDRYFDDSRIVYRGLSNFVMVGNCSVVRWADVRVCNSFGCSERTTTPERLEPCLFTVGPPSSTPGAGVQ